MDISTLRHCAPPPYPYLEVGVAKLGKLLQLWQKKIHPFGISISAYLLSKILPYSFYENQSNVTVL